WVVVLPPPPPAWPVRALGGSAERLPSARVLLLTDQPPDPAWLARGVEVAPIAPIRSREDYSRFMLTGLARFIETPFALVVQWDGWVLDGQAFDPVFWHHDYIGARWPHRAPPHVVGNGGFSLRSRRLLNALEALAPELIPGEAEDEAIAVRLRPRLEQEFGIVFAEPEVADRFSFDVGRPVGPTLGFHGVFNFWQVLTPDELMAFAQTAPDALVRGPGFQALTRNLLDLKRFDAARVCLERLEAVLGAAPLAALRKRLAEGRAVGRPPASTMVPAPGSRLAPCPCGSGRRYKDCHGALGTQPRPVLNADALVEEALRLHEAGQTALAVERYERVLGEAPEHPVALHFLGLALYQQGAPSVGLEASWHALRAAPNVAEWWSNHAAAAWAAGRYTLGVHAAERAVALDPSHVGGWTNLGLNLRGLARLPESLAAFDRALELAPGFAYARWNRSLSLLALGRYEEGFADYELRLGFPQTQPLGAIPEAPLWDGKAAPGHLLVLAEQGLGDTLMFARFLPALAACAERVTLACHAPLVPLLARNLPGISVIAVGAHEGGRYDHWCGLWSLPARLGIGRDTLPAPASYLCPDPARVAHWRERVQAAAAGRPAVGLVWQGQFAGQDHGMAARSIAPELLAPWVEAQPGIAWFSLQWGAPAPAAANLIDWSSELGPFEALAGLIAALDRVVTIDTAAAHLAGALGVSTCVALCHAGEWRYGTAEVEGARCPWYPSMRLYRQGPERRWVPVLADIARTLADA
ncbi:MAG: DUF5672 family protein, partial [Casimicrobiaceae bacterium]